MENRRSLAIFGVMIFLLSGCILMVEPPTPAEGYTLFNPVAEWFFDEGTGQIARDNTGNGYDLLLGGSTSPQTSDPSWVGGLNGSALYLDGSDDKAQLDSGSDLNMNSHYTFEIWFNTTLKRSYLALIDKRAGTTTGTGYTVYLNDGKPRLSVYGGSGNDGGMMGTTDLRDGKWHHLVITYDGTQGVIYVDGEIEKTRSFSALPASNSAKFSIGVRSGGWGGYMWYRGLIDHAAVFDKALTEEEVLERYVQQEEEGRHSFWPMNEEGTQEVVDVISTNHGHLGFDTGVDVKDPERYFGSNESGLRFDGENDMVTLGTLDLSITDSLSVSMWIWTADVVTEQDLLTHEIINNGTRVSFFRLYIKDHKLNVEARWDDDGDTDPDPFPYANGDPFTSHRDIPKGRWTHIAFYHNNEEHESGFLIDGKESGSIITMYPQLMEQPEWMLGNSKAEDHPFGGCMDEVHIWNHAINSSVVNDVRTSITVNEREPGIPNDLRVRSGDSFVEINWTPPFDIGTAFISGYRIMRSEDYGTFQNLASVDDRTFHYNDTELTNGVNYRYSVSAFNAFGEGEGTAWISATPYGLPSAPRNLDIVTGDSFCLVTWSPPIDDGGTEIRTYSIFRDDGRGWVQIATQSGEKLGLNDTDLDNGVEYSYFLKATNMIGTSPSSLIIKGTPLTIPDPPRNLAGTTGDEFVYLEWSSPEDDGGTPVFAYHVLRRSELTEPFMILWSLNEEETSYNDTEVENGQTYQYIIRAFNMMGGSANSNMVTMVPMSVPSLPEGLEIAYGDSYIKLTWGEPLDLGGDRLGGYIIQRRSDGDWGDLNKLNPRNTEYNDTTVDNGIVYSYRVLAYNSMGSSEYSVVVSDTPRTVPQSPENPRIAWGNSFIHLFWDPPEDDGGSSVSSYLVVMILSPGEYQVLGELDPEITDFNHTSLINGMVYNFGIIAVNTEGESLLSRQVSGTPKTVPGVVSNLTILSGNGFVLLRWSEPLDNGGTGIKGYTVFKYISGEAESLEMTDLSSGARDYNDTNVDNGVSYRYYIVAHNSVGAGASSQEMRGDPKEEDDDKGSSLVFIILGILAFVVMLIVLILVLLMVMRSKKKEEEPGETVPEAVTGPAGPMLPGAPATTSPMTLGPAGVPARGLPGGQPLNRLPPMSYPLQTQQAAIPPGQLPPASQPPTYIQAPMPVARDVMQPSPAESQQVPINSGQPQSEPGLVQPPPGADQTMPMQATPVDTPQPDPASQPPPVHANTGQQTSVPVGHQAPVTGSPSVQGTGIPRSSETIQKQTPGTDPGLTQAPVQKEGSSAQEKTSTVTGQNTSE